MADWSYFAKKKLPEEPSQGDTRDQDIGEKIEKESGIDASVFKNQALVLISNNDNYINQKNLSSNEAFSRQ